MRILPRDEKFFDLFQQQAACSVETANLIAAALSADRCDWDALWTGVHAIERRGDGLTYEALTRVHNTYLTPIDPEDIHNLSAALDDVLDDLDELARRLQIFRLETIPASVRDFVGLLCAQALACQAAVAALEDKDRARPQLARINELETEADQLYHEALALLFAAPMDPIALIKLKDLYESLETSADRFERAAHVIEQILLKNS